MEDYHNELAEIEELLSENRYEECSMKCGKRIELVLKHLAKGYLETTSEAHRRSLATKIRQGQPLERQSLGGLIKLYKDEGILATLVNRQNANHKELRALDLDMIVHIRNKAAHDRQDDINIEKSDALLLYGSLLKLLTITGLLGVKESEKIDVVPLADQARGESVRPKVERIEGQPVLNVTDPKIVMTPRNSDEKTPPSQPLIDAGQNTQVPHAGKTVTLYMNKKSGNCFVYVKQIDTNTLSLITPLGELKSLKEDLFEEYGEVPESEAIRKGLITTDQIAKHRSSEKTLHESNNKRQPLPPEPSQLCHGKKVSQDELIPHIVRILQKHGGHARKDAVEKEICHTFRDVFNESWYRETVSNGIPRWKHNIAWAKERAKKKGLIKPSVDSGRGSWELTDKGRKY